MARFVYHNGYLKNIVFILAWSDLSKKISDIKVFEVYCRAYLKEIKKVEQNDLLAYISMHTAFFFFSKNSWFFFFSPYTEILFLKDIGRAEKNLISLKYEIVYFSTSKKISQKHSFLFIFLFYFIFKKL